MSYKVDRARILDEVEAELYRQDRKWGEQNHPDAYPSANYPIASSGHCKMLTDLRAQEGHITYADILIEELAESVDEAKAGDKGKLREELVQVAAVAVAWVEKLDREDSA